MKNVCSSLVMCMLLLSIDRVKASHDDISQRSFDDICKLPYTKKLAILKEYCDDPRELINVSEYNIDNFLSEAMANQGEDPASRVSLVFRNVSDSLDAAVRLEVDSFGDIPKGNISKEIKDVFDVKFCVLSPVRGWDSEPFYPYHIRKISPSPLDFRKYLRVHDLSKISSSKLFDLFDNKKGYKDPYLVYATVGVFASQMMDQSVPRDDLIMLHEKIVNFISLIHPLEVKSEDDIVSIKWREPDHIVGEDKYWRKYAVGDILHDVTVADIIELVAEPCLGDASPFDDDAKNVIANALGDKGFARIIVEKGFIDVMNPLKSAQQSSIVREEA